MSLREAILGNAQLRTRSMSTGELAKAAGAPLSDTFRELGQLESEGLLTRRLGVGSIASVGWRLAGDAP
jgi:DNA-binding IclR family transcriptional regulator